MHKQHLIIVAIATSFIFWIIPVFHVDAAALYFKEPSVSVNVGDSFETVLYFDADEGSINALEGTVIFPAGALELSEIRDGDSILTFWVEKPDLDIARGGSFTFSGIIPGGFAQQGGRVLSLIFTARQQGGATMTLADARAYLNDSTGNQVDLSVGSFHAETAVSTSEPIIVPALLDDEQPETFVPEIASDAHIFDGEHFLTFDTVDKSSGIDHYEILETKMKLPMLAIFSRWQETKSPYVLTDQSQSSYLFVKAVDREGNTRIERVEPAHPVAGYKDPNIYAMILLGILSAFLIFMGIKKSIPYVKRKLFHHDKA